MAKVVVPLVLTAVLTGYPRAHAAVWVQEEPKNMGAWSYIAPRLEQAFGREPGYAGRDAAASPAVGTVYQHKLELAALLNSAFSI